MQPLSLSPFTPPGRYPGQFLLPEGFALPPLPHLVVLAVAVVLVGAGLYVRRPSVDARLVLAFAPWMAAGSGLHVLYVLDALPTPVSPFGGTPAVYLAVGALAGAVWLVADRIAEGRVGGRDVPPERRSSLPVGVVGVGGVVLLAPTVAIALLEGAESGTLELFWPAIGLVVTVPVTVATWAALTRLAPGAREAGSVGVLVVFSHALDGVSTAIGVEILGFGERTPLSQVVLDVGAALPTADLLGAAWLFVLVKLVVAGVVVALFDDFLEESPGEALLLLGLIAAVGLGPGAHNLLLFAATAG